MRATIGSFAAAAAVIGTATASAADLHVPSQYPTIQAAIDAASAGDSIVVSPGDYVESIDFGGKAISVRSAVIGESRILAPEGLRSVVSVSGEPEGTRLVGFKLTRSGSVGGGLVAINSSLLIESCVFDSCVNAAGGGAFVSGGRVSFRDCQFIACTALGPGGAYGSSGGVHLNGGVTDIYACQFVQCDGGCAAEAIMHDGGGSVEVRHSRVTGSSSATCFGQVYNAEGALLIEDTIFENSNKVAVFAWSEYTVRRCIFRDISSHAVLERRSGLYTVDACQFVNCHALASIFFSYTQPFPGGFAIGNSRFCNSTWEWSLVHGDWTDLGGNVFGCSAEPDCNGDGIVDAQQIARGELPDYNSNRVPDCCESSTPCELGNYPVQWRVEDGGNGHWYDMTESPGTWDQMQMLAQQSGGQLASIANNAENSFVRSRMPPTGGCWIGARKLPGLPWEWADGSNWSFTNWCPGEPCCFDQGLYVYVGGSGCWDDHNQIDTPRRGVIEWSADCNGDGIVDYGQILQGQLVDANNNGVPDSCEVDPCPADVTRNGVVDGVDLAAILGAWGTDGQNQFDCDIDNDGIVSGTDLAFVLGGWGPCP